MSGNANADHEVSNDPAKNESTKTSGWNSLPFELQIMIIESLEHQSFRKAWLNCRIVSRSFQEATERAFKTRIVNKLYFALPMSGFDAVKLAGGPAQDFHPMAFITSAIPFSHISPDNTQVVFQVKRDSKYAVTCDTPLGEIPLRDTQIRIGGRFLPLEPLEKFWWEQAFDRSENAPKIHRKHRPCVVHSELRWSLRNTYEGHIHGSEIRVTMPWRLMMSSVLGDESELANEMRYLARKDLEVTHWHMDPVMEPGMRIALQSEVVRLERFKKCFEDAIHYTAGYKRQRWGYLCELFTTLKGEKSVWYEEWLSVITQGHSLVNTKS
ncbi:hypothetical protein F5Y00DRAFT_236345 [Daldinia vernicosa]|uniref:uncharacterized protein n=1 Tax=Daldinia vernicosa TaxID=114800 RepID=UPI002008D028|nr:uncharacterized protein F5Y00DRAFT_236345 [Daldinia vernicosa]KAI0849002.1 hypothetical protein F5Y00DRAFT_236345 [Daldinia vernicosa]